MPVRSRSRTGPGTRFSPWLITSVVVLAGVPVMAAWLVLSPSPGPRTLNQVPNQPEPAPAAAATGPTGACPALPDSGDTTLTSAPTDTTWSVIDGALAPASPSAGPVQVTATVSSCFAHDPEGALIAAVRLQEQVADATAANWPAAAAALAPSPTTDTIKAQVATVLAQAANAGDPGQAFAEVAGFDLLSYSPAQAVVDLVYRTQAGALYAAATTLAWTSGDWRLVPVGVNSLTSPQTAVPNLVGYVEWEQP
jgi:hypothetical protein